MEDTDTFEKWLHQMLDDAKKQLGITDETLAWVLLREGMAAYLRTIGRKHVI